MKRTDHYELEEKVGKYLTVSYDSESDYVNISESTDLRGFFPSHYSSVIISKKLISKLIKALKKIEENIE